MVWSPTIQPHFIGAGALCDLAHWEPAKTLDNSCAFPSPMQAQHAIRKGACRYLSQRGWTCMLYVTALSVVVTWDGDTMANQYEDEDYRDVIKKTAMLPWASQQVSDRP